MSFIPKFMKTPTWALLGTGFVGSTIYMTYKSKLDQRLTHTLVEESIHLLENNEEVLELVGAPIMVESSLRNRADLGDNINNFTYFVSGPRGKLRVELASCARNLSGLGVNSKGKQILKDMNNGKTLKEVTSDLDKSNESSSRGFLSWFSSNDNNSVEELNESSIKNVNELKYTTIEQKIQKRLKKNAHGEYTIPSNVPEFNYNNYYVPDPSVVKHEENIYELEGNNQKLSSDSKFWNIEYMFAEVDDSVRIMVAPIPEKEKSEEPILYRETYGDIAQEYIERRNSRRDFRKAQTPEEQEELRKFRLRQMYKDIAYTRFYMLCGFFLIGSSAYIMFRKNKRLPITNNIIHTRTKKAISDNLVLRKILGDKIIFPNQTIGAKIGNDAEFKFQALGNNGHYAVADVSGEYDEKKLDWKVQRFQVSVYNSEGIEIPNEENWGIVKE